jgi:hypothetical protein
MNMIFEDGAIIDYENRSKFLRYRSGSLPELSCQFPVTFNAATGEVGIDFTKLSGMRWDAPKVRGFSETEKGDLRKRIKLFVEEKGLPFVYTEPVKLIE